MMNPTTDAQAPEATTPEQPETRTATERGVTAARKRRDLGQRALGAAIGCAIALVACKDPAGGDRPVGTPPPPSTPIVTSSASGASGASGGAAAKAGHGPCEAANVGVSDAKVAALIPASVAGFCVPKSGEVRSWGDGTGHKIEDVSDLIDGYGETYAKDFYAKRYDSLKYVDGNGGAAEVDVALTTYDKPENAYALFTYEVVNNVDPEPSVAKREGRRPMQALAFGGAAALGNAKALVWKGNYLVELTYNPDSTMTLAQATAAADVILPKVAQAVGDKIMGASDLPADVRALPTEADGRIPLGIEYIPPKYTRPEGKNDALKLSVTGGYATAFLKEGDKRSRVIAMARDDRDAARDAIDVFRKIPGALPIKDTDLGDDAIYFTFPVGSGGAGAGGKAEGVAVRRGALVLVMIDEELALGEPGAKDGGPRTSKDEKIAKLKKLFASRAAAKPAPSAAASGAAHP